VDAERQAVLAVARVGLWLGIAACLLPFDRLGEQPVWLWWGLADGTALDVLALLAPGACAGVCALIAWRRPCKVTAAAGLSAALLCAWALGWAASLGSHPVPGYAHLGLGLPALFGHRLGLLVGGLGLLAAGVRLGARGFLEPLDGREPLADPWPAGRVLLALGLGAVALAYLLPVRGELPLWSLGTGLASALGAARGAEELSLLAGQVLSLGPLFLALAAAPRMVRPAGASGGALPLVAVAYLPALGLLMGLRTWPFDPALALVHLRAALLLAGVLAILGLALPALLRGAWYEIPWLLGRLGRSDVMLAVALSAPEPSVGLAAGLRRLRPWGRAFARRRLRLWQTAAAEVPGAAPADLSGVIRCLERRWQEERLGGAPAGGSSPDWPWALRSAWPLALALAVLAGLGLAAWSASRRPPADSAWRLAQPSPAVEALFTRRLPEVVLDMSRAPQPLGRLPGWPGLAGALAAVEPEAPGLERAVSALLEAGRHGARRTLGVRRARDRLNGLLQAAGLPFYVSARVRWGPGDGGGGLFYLLVYRIEACARYRLAGSDRVFGVLLVRRVDRLNVVEGYLGMTEQAEAFVTVYLDRLEDYAGDRLAAVAARFGPVGGALRRALGELGLPEDEAPALGGALGERLVEGLARHELHHRLVGVEPEPPPLLWRLLAVYPEEAVRGVTAELGAYLGELRLDGIYARLRLAWMLDELDDEGGDDGYHGWARTFLVSRLLGEDVCTQPACRTALAWRLQALPPEELLARVDRLHRALFGDPTPIFERLPAPN